MISNNLTGWMNYSEFLTDAKTRRRATCLTLKHWAKNLCADEADMLARELFYILSIHTLAEPELHLLHGLTKQRLPLPDDQRVKTLILLRRYIQVAGNFQAGTLEMLEMLEHLLAKKQDLPKVFGLYLKFCGDSDVLLSGLHTLLCSTYKG